MTSQADEISIIDITPENVSGSGIFCIRDKKNPGFDSKVEWFKSEINKGLSIKIALDSQNKQLGFIEYIPSELAWRPVQATNYLFIHCIALFVKEARHQGIGTALLEQCLQDAKQRNKSGICAMSSDGAWMANKTLFEKNGFVIADKLGRFELMVRPLDNDHAQPRFFDWTKQAAKYQGWNLIYSDQCPWHEKSVKDLKHSALEHTIELHAIKLTSPEEAQNAPSGFGTFSLVKDGRLLEDHYLSRTRFENIIRQEMKKQPSS